MVLEIDREEIDCNNVMECIYSLNELDKDVLAVLSEEEGMTSSEIAEKVEKDQSTAYRSLEKLFECGLVYKEKENIRKGGYYFLYYLRPLDKVKEEALECVDEWYQEMKKAIEKMDQSHL